MIFQFMNKLTAWLRLLLLSSMLAGCAALGLDDTVSPSAALTLHHAIQKELDHLVKTFDAHESKGDLELCAPMRFAVARFAVYQAIEERRGSGMEQMTRFISRAHRMMAFAEAKLRSRKCVDSDGDGLMDIIEIRHYKTNPNSADTDGDGLSDRQEVRRYRTNPLRSDTDGDLLSDGEEAIYRKISPRHPDSDGDGYADGFEVARGTDPRDQCSHPSAGPRRPAPWRKCVSRTGGKNNRGANSPLKRPSGHQEM
jgi:hypothetical protein